MQYGIHCTLCLWTLQKSWESGFVILLAILWSICRTPENSFGFSVFAKNSSTRIKIANVVTRLGRVSSRPLVKTVLSFAACFQTASSTTPSILDALFPEIYLLYSSLYCPCLGFGRKFKILILCLMRSSCWSNKCLWNKLLLIRATKVSLKFGSSMFLSRYDLLDVFLII